MSRLDIELVERGMVRSRSQAADLIKRGLVLVNGTCAYKAGQETCEEDVIAIAANVNAVSRAGQKLKDALCVWGIAVEGKNVLDIGASTGGFTEVLLERGAKKVVALDVGKGQLAERLRQDERVLSLEDTDVREYAASCTERYSLITCDISFISATLVLDSITLMLKSGGLLLLLVKPQFELSPKALTKTGVVKNPKDREKAVERVKRFAQMYGLQLLHEKQSPIQGKNGNIEYFHCYRKQETSGERMTRINKKEE